MAWNEGYVPWFNGGCCFGFVLEKHTAESRKNGGGAHHLVGRSFFVVVGVMGRGLWEQPWWPMLSERERIAEGKGGG